MKIAIPVANGLLTMHFGHCREFCILDVDEEGQTTEKQMVEPPPHEPGVLPKWLAEQGVEVVIAGGMGRRAQDLFAQAGLQIVTGAPCMEPEKLAHDFVWHELTTGENYCDH